MRILLLAVLFFFLSTSYAKITRGLVARYSKDYSRNEDLKILKRHTISLGGKAVPALIEVMKNGKYPEKNRWVATFLLGRIAGKKSVPFISKFLRHPDWIMRMASLKTMLALKQKGKKYATMYARLLKDKSLIVRIQALENIHRLNLVDFAPSVWSMLYDKQNYTLVNKKLKRTNVIKRIVKAVGDLKYKKALRPLLKMAQKDKYRDIFDEIDYSLQKITGKRSPGKAVKDKRNYWKKVTI